MHWYEDEDLWSGFSEVMFSPQRAVQAMQAFDNVHHELYDAVHWLDFRHAMAVFAGLSTGAAYLVARWAADREPARTHLVIGADTGHRYVERVFARHHEALDPAVLAPREIHSLDELEMPWSAMAWRRSRYPGKDTDRDGANFRRYGSGPPVAE